MPHQFAITGLDPATGRVVEMELTAETVIEAMRAAKEMGLRYVAVRRADQPEVDSTPPIEQPDGPPMDLAPPSSPRPPPDATETGDSGSRRLNGAGEPAPPS